MSTRNLTVVGLDAATFDVIDPLIEAGELPNLARLFESGSRGVLRSVTHPLTPHAWATMTTGVNAGRHGIWDFSERSGGGYELRLINGSYRRAPAVWDRLAAADIPAGIVNIPFTWPAPELQGFAISGFDAAAREEGLTFPRDLVTEIQQKFGPLVLDHRFPIGKDGGVDLDLVRAAAEQKVEVALWLAERFRPQLLFVVFMAADHVHHICWDDWERRGPESAVAEVYRILDRATGALADAAGPDADVLVVSDHGGGRLDGVVNLNAYLASKGFLAYRGADAAVGRKLARRLFELRRKLPEGLRTSVKRRLPGVRARAYEATQFTVVDWSRTQAFAYGTFGNVIVNLQGRERDGTVSPEDYDRVRGEVAQALLELRGPEGEQIVAAVHRREDLFHGPELEKLPDLIVEFDRYTWLGKGNLRSRAQLALGPHRDRAGQQALVCRKPPARGRDGALRPVGAEGRHDRRRDRRRRADDPVSPLAAAPDRPRRPPRDGGHRLRAARAAAARVRGPRGRDGGRGRELRSGGRGVRRGAPARPRLPRVVGACPAAAGGTGPPYELVWASTYSRSSLTSRSSAPSDTSTSSPAFATASSSCARSSTSVTRPASTSRRATGS